mmetsp:Transcript_21018/g.42263  ORF Transcript_21018/g.42263 Transcript_21018/m.42263 type:complete len:208 (+) Transcript_21018:435-1058(+)
MNEGMATRKLSQSMPRTGAIMKAPMRTSGTAVATWGTALSRGPMKAESKKSAATTTAIRPVLAPSTMPALLSLAMMTGLVPNTAPTIVARPELAKMEVLLGTVSCLNKPAMPIKPYCTPAKSNNATNNKTAVPTSMATSGFPPSVHAAKLMTKAESNLGIETTADGGSASPTTQLAMAMSQMPMSIAPGILPMTNTAEIIKKPASAR